MLKHFELLNLPGTPETGLIRAKQVKRRRAAHDVVRYARRQAQAIVENADERARAASQQGYIEGFAVGLEQSLAICAMQMADEHAVLAGLRHAMREQLAQWLADTLREPALAALIEKEIAGDAGPGPGGVLRIAVPPRLQALGERLGERLRARGLDAQVVPGADAERMLVSWGDRVWSLALRATAQDWAEQCLNERGAPLNPDQAARQLAAQAAQRLEASLGSLATTGRAPRVRPSPSAPDSAPVNTPEFTAMQASTQGQTS